ncbi:two-partner secretion domain-containing protein [Pseudomonas sp. A6]|uniref:two-partner secretion domain-containing protein n=1 Tax=Pseudomonas sp. A6 TaxID=410021 RepID=UPI0040298FA8
MDIRRPFHQAIASALAGLLFLNPIVAAAAQLAVDAAAGGNTQIGAAGNGVPIVNIATPNGSGLSHNKFSDYGVGQQGLILNNATGKTQGTQLGGIILGNPNLKGQAAQKILNEVTGANPSQLKGYTEVAGQGAHVIVANPHGITCNGCGFINTPRATLTTGKPILAGERLQGYDVDGGEIAIEGAGLNASNLDQFELITRSAKLNADLYARQLTVVAGRNTVDAQTLAATAKPDDGSAKPQLAIDSSALGGMYANTIRLVGTEQGVGVKLAGNMAASAGDIRIDANGKLELAQVAASGDLALKGQDVALNGPTYAGGSASVQASGALSNAQSLAAGSTIELKANQLSNSGVIEAGVNADNSRNAGGDLSIDAQHLRNSGSLIATRQLQARAAVLDNRNGQIGGQHIHISGGALDNRLGLFAAEQSLRLDLASLDNREQGLLSSQGGLTGRVGSLNNQQGGITARAVELQGDSLDNRGGQLYAETELALDLGANPDNRGGRLEGQGVQVRTANLDNSAGGILSGAGGLLQLATGHFDNRAGIAQGAALLLDADSIANSDGHLAATHGDARVNSAGFDNRAGGLFASQALALYAGDFLNHGGQVGARDIDFSLRGALDNTLGLIEAGNQLTLTAAGLSNAQGRVRALGQQGATRLSIGGLLDNREGLLESAAADLLLTSGDLRNDDGSVRHLGNGGFGIDLAQLGLAGGSFVTNAALNLSAASWTNRSSLQARELTLDIGQLEQAAEGRLLASQALRGTGGDWRNAGLIASDGDLALNLGGRYSGSGQLSSLGELGLDAASLALDGSASIIGGGATRISIGGSLDNTGRITAAGDLLLRAANLNNTGTLGSAAGLRIESADLLNENGLLFSGGDMALRVERFVNRYADVYSLGALDIAADDRQGRARVVENRSATLEAQGDLAIASDSLKNTQDSFRLGQKLISGEIIVRCYDCSGDHYNVDYIAREVYASEVQEASPAAFIQAGGNLRVDAQDFENTASTLAAGGDIAISANSFVNQGINGGESIRTRIFNSGRVTDGTVERFVGHYVLPYNLANNADPSVFSYWDSFIGGLNQGTVTPTELANGLLLHVYRDADGNLHRPMHVPDYQANHYDPDNLLELPSALYDLGFLSDVWEYRPGGATSANAVIQAAGAVQISAGERLDNGVIHPGIAYDGGVARIEDVQVDGQSQPLVVVLNPQLPPDLAQQAVNPITLPGFRLPQGEHGLFRLNAPDSGHPYLIETNPALAGLKQFLGSDYLLAQLGYDPAQAQQRLGDGLYEQRLIRQALVARTGQRFIAGLSSDEALFRYLMDNAIGYKDRLGLSLGVALSAGQVAALTHDIVWLEEAEVNGRKVLVPVLYLAQAEHRLAPNGALIQGQDLALISGGELNNAGTLRASNDLGATAANIGNSGLMESNRHLQLLATQSIRNAAGGIISGRDVSLAALTGDVVNERTLTQVQGQARGASLQTSLLDSAARIEADGDLSISSGRDLLNLGGQLQAKGDIQLQAGRDVLIGAVESVDSNARQDKRHSWEQTEVRQHAAGVQAGGDLQISAGRDIGVLASHLEAGGDANLAAAGNLLLGAAQEQSSREYHYRRSGKKVDSEDSRVSQRGTSLNAAGDVTLSAGQNLTLEASQVGAGKEAFLVAGDKLQLLAGHDSEHSLYQKQKKGSLGSKSFKRDEVTDVKAVGSQVSAGGDITLLSGGDQKYQAARLESGNDIAIVSGGSVTFEAVKDLHQESHEKSKSDLAWQSAKGKGQTDETLRQSQLIAQGELAIKSVEGLKIDIKYIDQKSVGRTIDAMVQADPDLAWLKEAEARGDVDWRRVQEVHDSWEYSSSGMGPAAQLAVAIVLSVATYGAASTAVGTAAGATAGSSTAMAAAGVSATGATVAAGWGNVALASGAASLASTGGVSAINNKGDIGTALKDTLSSDGLRQAMIAGALGGLTTGYFDDLVGTQTKFVNGKVVVDLSSPNGVAAFAANQALQNMTSAALNKVTGGSASFGDALKGSLYNTLAAAGFNAVGDFGQAHKLDTGSGQMVVLHALVGGLAAEARGESFATGALVAGLNEAVVKDLDALVSSYSPENREALLSMSSQLLGLVATVAQDPDADTNKLETGSWVAKNSTQYNHELHRKNAESFAEGALDFCKKQPAYCGPGADQVSEQDMMDALAATAAHGEGIDKVKPEALRLVNQFLVNPDLADTLQTDLFAPTASEQQRLNTLEKAELAAAGVSAAALAKAVMAGGGQLLSKLAGALKGQDSKGSATALQIFGGRRVDDLAAAASNPINKEGLTQAARALTKHASGQREMGTFPKLSGGIKQQNETAQKIVDEILNNPKSTFTNLGRGGLEVRAPDGRGLRYNSDGSFSGFVD